MYVIQCQFIERYDGIPQEPFIFSSTSIWGGEIKLIPAIKGVTEPKKYTSIKRAEQGIKSLDKRVADPYKLEILDEKDAEW